MSRSGHGESTQDPENGHNRLKTAHDRRRAPGRAVGCHGRPVRPARRRRAARRRPAGTPPWTPPPSRTATTRPSWRFAEPLISATADEVRRLIAKAKEWAAALGKPVALWLSDRQDAFVTGIAAEFPDVPHRYCDNHFLRDVAKPVLEADSHAKVQMRKKVRGLRKIEQAVLKRAECRGVGRTHCGDDRGSRCRSSGESMAAGGPGAARRPATRTRPSAVVLDYCAAVRGILNDDQGGPLHPPGLRMAEALDEVRESIQRNLDEKKGGSQRSNSADWPAASTAAWTPSEPNKRRSETTSRTSRK